MKKSWIFSRYGGGLLLFFALFLSLCGCGTRAVQQENNIICQSLPHAPYPAVLTELFPDRAVQQQEGGLYTSFGQGAAVEAFASQALRADRAGAYWYPQYLATVVIAVDRAQTDVMIGGWVDVLAMGERVGLISSADLGHVMAAIAAGQNDGATDFSLPDAARLLAPLQADNRLVTDDDTAPVLICFDYQAVALNKSGRDLEIIVPAEGSLTFEKGLLSPAPLAMPDSRAALVAAGLRLVNGTCDENFYPAAEAYAPAVLFADHAYLNTALRDTATIWRRAVLHTHLYTSASGQEHQLFALLFIILAIFLAGSIAYRAMQQGVRRSALLCSALLVCWTLVRIFKYQIAPPTVLTRYAWYSFYIFEMGISLVFLWMAFVIDRPKDNRRLPGWWLGLLGVNGVMVALVLTNDFHQLAFAMDLTGTSWDSQYAYGPVYYGVLAVIFLQVLASQIIMVRKSWQRPWRLAFLFPMGLYLLMGLYCTAYILRLPVVFASDMTLVTGVFSLLCLEVFVQIGLVPVNRSYRRFFAWAPQHMQIVNDRGQVVLASAKAEPVDTAVWQSFCQTPHEPQPVGADELLFAGRVKGGLVIWREDISRVNQLHRDIEASLKQLQAANMLLEREEMIRGQLVSFQARTSLFAALKNEIRKQSETLSHMLRHIPRDETRHRAIAQTALLVCYIKRRCNLFFMEQNSSVTSAGELTVYMDELADFAKVAGLTCFCSCILTVPVPLRQAVLLYDFFYALLDWQGQRQSLSLFLQILDENGLVMRVMPSGQMDDFVPEDELLAKITAAGGTFSRRPLYDADGFWLTFPKGGILSD